MNLLLLLALSVPQPIPVDRVELNHYSHGEHVFDQLIFYSWSSQRKRFDVREWRLKKSDSMVPVPRRGGYMLRWHDDGVLREVTTNSFRETWTQYDPEVIEREHLAQDQRLPVLNNEKETQ